MLGRGVEFTTHPSSRAKVGERIKSYLWAFMESYTVNLTFTFTHFSTLIVWLIVEIRNPEFPSTETSVRFHWTRELLNARSLHRYDYSYPQMLSAGYNEERANKL